MLNTKLTHWTYIRVQPENSCSDKLPYVMHWSHKRIFATFLCACRWCHIVSFTILPDSPFHLAVAEGLGVTSDCDVTATLQTPLATCTSLARAYGACALLYYDGTCDVLGCANKNDFQLRVGDNAANVYVWGNLFGKSAYTPKNGGGGGGGGGLPGMHL